MRSPVCDPLRPRSLSRLPLPLMMLLLPPLLPLLMLPLPLLLLPSLAAAAETSDPRRSHPRLTRPPAHRSARAARAARPRARGLRRSRARRARCSAACRGRRDPRPPQTLVFGPRPPGGAARWARKSADKDPAPARADRARVRRSGSGSRPHTTRCSTAWFPSLPPLPAPPNPVRNGRTSLPNPVRIAAPRAARARASGRLILGAAARFRERFRIARRIWCKNASLLLRLLHCCLLEAALHERTSIPLLSQTALSMRANRLCVLYSVSICILYI